MKSDFSEHSSIADNTANGNGKTQANRRHQAAELLLEQSVILKRPALWSRVLIWLILSATTSGLICAAVTKIDQTVVGTGTLEPKGDVPEIKAPTEGVVREIFVHEGESVKKNQLLLTFEPSVPKADLESVIKIGAALDKQTQEKLIDAILNNPKQAIKYQELRAPVGGMVFTQKPLSQGFVATTAQTLLKIVPNDNLVASVFLRNRDIGFVREGMEVDVRIDTFPSTEFGSIKGKLISIGSQALPPNEERHFYTFPAKIQLQRQSLMVNGKLMPLQSGMAVQCSILVRKRPLLSILTDLFDTQVKSIESIK